MGVLIINPNLTMEQSDQATVFHQELKGQLEEYGAEHEIVSSRNILRMEERLDEKATVIVYNGSVPFEENVRKFLETALNKNAQILPIAFDKETRMPMGSISPKNSYDIWEQLRCRNLDENYIGTLAKMFARKIIAREFPTSYCESGEIFLSHKRSDGEDITARIYDKMIVQAKESNPFRDVVNISAGEEAQEVIDGEMKKCDVFVFIHTPESGQSDWILKELRYALLRNIPVLWIQIDHADIEGLRIKPSEKPHLCRDTKDFDDEKKLTEFVDQILQKAFELIMDRSGQVWEYVELFKKLFGDDQEIEDRQNMIYHVSARRKGYRYPQRNIEQYYQIFGRTPTEKDAAALRERLKGKTMDSMVILTDRIVAKIVREEIVFDTMQNFYYYWDKYVKGEKKGEKKMEIVVSGAFPDSDEIYKQSLTDALILFARTIIRSGYELTFGAHPTFQELFYEVAKETEPDDFKNRINMYISQWFLDQDAGKEKEYEQKYNLQITEKKNDALSSLSEMRREMIQRKDVKALVCLGGKIKKDKNTEGIREEIALARQYGIPVFVVGSVGGCSSQVAVEYKKAGWEKLNDAPAEINEKFLTDIDYFNMAQEMIRFLSA
ncbi:MAG: TIR domain-containing protein [Blautia sp.]|nr:TIR domain-containing protein [Blautia sp.]